MVADPDKDLIKAPPVGWRQVSPQMISTDDGKYLVRRDGFGAQLLFDRTNIEFNSVGAAIAGAAVERRRREGPKAEMVTNPYIGGVTLTKDQWETIKSLLRLAPATYEELDEGTRKLVAREWFENIRRMVISS